MPASAPVGRASAGTGYPERFGRGLDDGPRNDRSRSIRGKSMRTILTQLIASDMLADISFVLLCLSIVGWTVGIGGRP